MCRGGHTKMGMSDGGKGSNPRPLSISTEEFEDRFEAIFGKKTKKSSDEKVEDESSDSNTNDRQQPSN